MTPDPMQRTAHDDLAYIRRTLDAAGRLSSVPGRGLVAIGLLALAAVVLNARVTGTPWDAADPMTALTVWGALLGASVAVGGLAMARKARRMGQPMWSPVLRRALWGYGAAMGLGAVLTASAVAASRFELLPEIWLGCYGAALVSAGAMSIAPVRWMGLAFLALAAAAVALPPSAGLAMLGLGFGWLHIVFGAWIARRYDG